MPRPRCEQPPLLEHVAAAHPETGCGQGLRNFLEAWGEATQAVGEGLACVFTFGIVCPDRDDGGAGDPALQSLAPYPGWMSPRSRGTFALERTAPHAPGTYAVQLHIAGDNYESTAPVRVVVYP